jgi:recombination protein RecA
MDVKQQVAAALKSVERQFGKGLLMALGDWKHEGVPVISSGSLVLDRALGIGGIPRGRVVEIYGPESSGKTTLALHMIARTQQQGLLTAFIDAEHALDTVYAKKLGVRVDELLVSQPDFGEQALNIAETLASVDGIGLIVVDSVAALVPRVEIEGEMGDQHVGTQARMMSQAMRKLTPLCARHDTTILFINQLRQKIGVMFGSPETTTGGNALKFYASVRVDIRRMGSVKKGDEVIGNKVRMKVVKNKMAPPFRTAESEIRFGMGFDRVGELLELGVADGLVTKAGSWYSFGDVRLGQGRDAVAAFLGENPEVEQALLARLTGPAEAGGPASAGEEAA